MSVSDKDINGEAMALKKFHAMMKTFLLHMVTSINFIALYSNHSGHIYACEYELLHKLPGLAVCLLFYLDLTLAWNMIHTLHYTQGYQISHHHQ